MTNREIIVAINNINEFANTERESKAAKLPLNAEMTVMENLSMLTNAYKSYDMTLASINARYTADDLKDFNTSVKKNSEINELQVMERSDVKITKKIKKSDFKEGALLSDIMLLEFMEE